MSEELLEAGATLPGSPRVGTAHDAITARRYTHPVLEGRTVVRLVGAAVGPAEDLSMEFLGFAQAGAPIEVGHARRQSLGFPAWALVHDPANGRHALALVKDMERLVRIAKSKPGNAKEGYDALADRLGAAAPHFLPTFWEQAGRAFAAGDNQRMAGACFGEARRAEQVHGLTVDEDRLRDVHLEFAFNGALTAKMLTEYTRGVVRRKPALEAYELVRALSIRRVAGGLAPHASIAEDLRRLATAAGLDAEEQAEIVVAQLLAFPAMLRAHMTVWKAYRTALIRLARRDPAIRARLLEILPEPPGYNVDPTEAWLELLEATGADRDLLAADPGRWLERMQVRRAGRYRRSPRSARLISLVERMTAALKAQGRPLSLWDRHSWSADLDVLDVCLAGGVPVAVADNESNQGFEIVSWAEDAGPGRRDLRAIAADPRTRPILERGVRAALQRLRTGEDVTSPALPAETVASTFGAVGVREALREVIIARTRNVGAATVIGLDETLSELASLWSPAGTQVAPDGFTALLDVDVAAILSRSLRGGLMEELCWPEYEQAATQKLSPQTGNSWPDLVVHDNQAAHVLHADGSVTEHVFRYPPAGEPLARQAYSQTICRVVGGHLLVSWSASGVLPAYWSSDPGEVFDLGRSGYSFAWGMRTLALPSPGGGVTTGDRPWHVGDTRGPDENHPVASDGVSFWRNELQRAESGLARQVWREFDPRTGDGGRVSMPGFFTADLPDGASLLAERCELRPAPARFAESPLGWRDGLVGWRVTNLPDGSQLGEAIDGRRVTWRRIGEAATGSAGQPACLVAAIKLPGDDRPRPVTGVTHYGSDMNLTVWTADGTAPIAHCGQSAILPPLAWWHALRPRDERGSLALRAVDDRIALSLLEVDDSATTLTQITEAVTANVVAHLAEVTDAMLRSAVVGTIVRSLRLRRRLAGVPDLLSAVPDEVASVPEVSDEALRLAWGGLFGHRSYSYYSGGAGPRYEILRQIQAVGALMAGGEAEQVPAAAPTWAEFLAGPGALAIRAASPVATDIDRAALSALLETLAGTVLAGAGRSLRVLTVARDHEFTQVQTLVEGSQVTVLLPGDRHRHHNRQAWLGTAIQIATGGAFTPPPGMTVRHETSGGGWSGGERIRVFTGLLRAQGPAPWRAEAVEQLTAATGMTRGEAALLLAGLPGVDAWEANFLTAEQRRVLGITAAQARVARDSLRNLNAGQRVALVDAAMPEDPASLWDHGPDVASLARRWIELCGPRVAISEQLLADGAKVLHHRDIADILQAIAQPTEGSWLTTDGRSTSGSWHQVETTAKGSSDPFTGAHVSACATVLGWLSYRLAWGDPLRQALPRALELTRDRLRNPDLLVGSGHHGASERPAVGPALVDGAVSYGDLVVHHLAPARLTGPDDPALGFIGEDMSYALRLLLSDEAVTMVSTPDGVVGWQHDPRVSVPDVVAGTAKELDMEDEAAAYYLQLLALPDPTDRHVLGWNGWTSARLKKVQSGLVERQLLVSAKRERAGRTVFLPGGWQTAKAPNLPVEIWKLPLYPAGSTMIFATRPVPDLFHHAWDRVAAGDVPRYLDLKEAR